MALVGYKYKEHILLLYTPPDLKNQEKKVNGFLIHTRYNGNMAKNSNSPFRLPEYIRPKSYHLFIEPDLEAQTFSGNVTININIGKKSDVVYLHAKDLVIGEVFIRQNKLVLIPQIKYINKDDTIELSLPKKIQGSFEVSISFTGIIHQDLRGFYLSTHQINGKEERIGATQFEAIDARRAFPCFDEPDMKAIFNLKINTPKNLSVLANTEIVEKKNTTKDRVEYSFAPSPIMSTYLLAWTIGKFESVKGAAKNGTVVSIYSPIGKKNTSGFALDTAIKSLDFFEDYFKIPYPLKKLDLVALPDFASAAMENWGLITFRETCLLVDKKNTPISNMQWTALVIAHEIAHQWFGNLVTMKWWDDLWLNEGFANYIEYACIDKIFPEWKIWEDFTHGDMGDALRLDALKSSHPIEVPIKDAHDIDEIFDDITYRKGASVIRMLAEFMGEDKFRKGISNYLKSYSYKNATTKDLWHYLEKSSNKPISKVMGAWTKQAGFPLLTVTSNLPNRESKIICSQCRYYRNRIIAKKENDKNLWPIPLSDGKKTYLLPQKKTSVIEIYNQAVTLNNEESSLVHIVYPNDFIERQKTALKNSKLTVLQRMGLVRNMRALAENGYYSAVDVIEFLKLFKAESHHLVLAEIWSSMMRIEHVFGKDEKVSAGLKQIYSQILENAWQYFKWKSIERDDKLRDSAILAMAFKLRNEKLINEALEIFHKGKDFTPTHLRAGVYRIVVRYGSKKDRIALNSILEKEKLHEEKMRIMASFAAVESKNELEEVLKFYISKKVKTQDSPLLFARLLGETKYPEEVYKFITKNYGTFLDRYGTGGHLLSRLVGSLAVIRDTNTLKDMRKFFKKYPAPGCSMTLSQVYERVEGSLAWNKDDSKKLLSYLNK